MRRPTLLELDATGYSLGVELPDEPPSYWTAERGDPTWTPAKGYSHAAGLLAILEQHDRQKGNRNR